MKTCKYGCGYPVFSHGYCKKHQYLRTDNRKPKPISKAKKKTGEFDLFLEIYEENKNNWVSRISGLPLYPPSHNMFHWQFSHLLPKGTYPEYRLNKANIWHITPLEHKLIDQGTEAKRIDYERAFKCSFSEYYKTKQSCKN